jgi:hypothetical protein
MRQRVTCANYHVFLTVEFVGDCAVRLVCSYTGVPQGCAGSCIERQYVSGTVAREEQVRGGRQQPGPHSTYIVGPPDVPWSVIDGFDCSGEIEEIISTGEAFGLSFPSEIKNAVALRCNHVEQPGSGMERRSKPV